MRYYALLLFGYLCELGLLVQPNSEPLITRRDTKVSSALRHNLSGAQVSDTVPVSCSRKKGSHH